MIYIGFMKTMTPSLRFGVVFLLLALAISARQNTAELPKLSGPFLGQQTPGNQSRVFAPDFVSTKLGELNSIFSRDGQEFYFSRRGMRERPAAIMVTRLKNDVWTKPEPVDFTSPHSDIDLFVTSDGGSMIFCSNRPHQKGDPAKADHDFWISKREGSRWAEPVLFAKEAASEYEDYFPVVTKSGNLYFNSQRGGPGTNDIYCSRFAGGKYSAAEKLPEPINTPSREFDAYVSPDENMIIFSSTKPGGFGGSDIYLSFKRADGTWTEPLNMGNDINSTASEYGATISPDGKYFFYTSTKNGSEDIYWVSAKIIDELRAKVKWQ